MSTNGLISRSWGPSAWLLFHSVAAGAPLKSTAAHRKAYRCFYKSMAKVLPCKACRTGYGNIIRSKPYELSDKALDTRRSLMYWTWKVHRRVNKRLHKRCNMSFKKFCVKYEALRATSCHSERQGCDSLKRKRSVVVVMTESQFRASKLRGSIIDISRKPQCRLLKT